MGGFPIHRVRGHRKKEGDWGTLDVCSLKAQWVWS